MGFLNVENKNLDISLIKESNKVIIILLNIRETDWNKCFNILQKWTRSILIYIPVTYKLK